MLIDTQLKPSRWQIYSELLSCCLICVLLWTAAIQPVFKIILIIVFLALQYGLRQALTGRQTVVQLWQIDGLNWAWRHNNDRTVKASLLAIEYRGVVLSLTFLVAGRQRHLVIWRDQVDATQWRYFKILANLRQSNTQIV